jgi:DNA-binding transcriptional LysR family regulator
VTQSAVSKQIKLLEAYFKQPLFERGKQGVGLSEAGKTLYLEVQPMLERLSDVSGGIKQWGVGRELTIVATVAVAHYWLFPRVARFKTLFPDININIYATDTIDERLCMQHELAILYGAGDWQAPLESHFLFPERIFAVCGLQYPLPPISNPRDLLQTELLHLDPVKWRWSNWKG